jgi:hypothetical protein
MSIYKTHWIAVVMSTQTINFVIVTPGIFTILTITKFIVCVDITTAIQWVMVMATQTINFVIVRIVNIPGVFELDEITIPDNISLPILQTQPGGSITIAGFTNPTPLTQVSAPMYIKHEGEAVTVHLHYVNGTVEQTVLSGLMTPNTAIKRVRIPPSEHSKRFIIEVGFQVPVQVSTV